MFTKPEHWGYHALGQVYSNCSFKDNLYFRRRILHLFTPSYLDFVYHFKVHPMRSVLSVNRNGTFAATRIQP